jgi:hypothetical protein
MLPGTSMSMEQQGNIRARFQQGNRVVRLAGFEGHEACFLDDFDSKHPQKRIILHDQNDGGDLPGDPATTSMIGEALKRNTTDRALFRLIGPYVGYPTVMRLQVQIRSFARQLSKVRCQTQTLKLALSVVFGIGHAHLLEEVSDRTPFLVLSVVHATEPQGLDGSIRSSNALW